jgi:NAD(P)-dependent dehydrogenase (short-subunit alcohol dehydrogenase family)
MGEQDHKVAIITGGSQASAPGLVAAYRRRDWTVVATSRAIKSTGTRPCSPSTGTCPVQAGHHLGGVSLDTLLEGWRPAPASD